MNSKKVMLGIIILLSVIVLGLLGFIVFREMNDTSDNPSKNETAVIKDTIDVLEITDEKVTYLVDLLDIETLFAETDEILGVLFSGKDKVTIDDLNSEQKLFFAIRTYMAEKKDIDSFKYCIDAEEYNKGLKDLIISKKDLEGLFVEDSSYLDNLTDEMIPVGSYRATSSKDSLTVCQLIYGVEGPGASSVSLKPVSAYQEGNKIVVSVKFIYEVMDDDYDDSDNPEHLRYNTYESYDKNGQIVETLDLYMDSNYFEEYDISKYDTYDLTFKVVDQKYVFESIERK